MTADRPRILLCTLSVRYANGMLGRNYAIHSLRLYALHDAEVASRVEIDSLECAHLEPPDELTQKILSLEPELLGLSCYVWNTRSLMEVARRVRAARPSIGIVAGGPDITPRAEALLRRHPSLDAVAVGEGEETLRLLLRRLAGLDEGAWQHGAGLLARGDSELRWGGEAPGVEMDSLPSFLEDAAIIETHGSLTVQGARGCRFHCAYCQYNNTPRRLRSLPLVLDEIHRFAARGGRVVSVLDAGINQARGRFRAVLQAIAEHPGLELAGPEVNVEQLDDEEIELLARATSTLAIGLQTTNPVTARNLRRGYRPARFAERVSKLRERGIRFTLDVIYGLPGDDYQSFCRTVDDAYALGPELVLPFQLQVLPGSTLAGEAERFGLRFDPEPPYFLQSCSSFSAEELRRARRLAQANDLMHTFTFCSRPFQLAARALALTPSAWLERFLEGSWREQGPVTDEELHRWSSAELRELLEALGQWLDASFEAGVPPAIQDALGAQFLRALLLTHPPPSPAELLPWPPEASWRPALSGSTILLALQEPRPSPQSAGHPLTHLLMWREPAGEISERALPAWLGAVLSLAGVDGAVTLEQLLASLRDGVPVEEQERVTALLLDELRELTSREAVRWLR